LPTLARIEPSARHLRQGAAASVMAGTSVERSSTMTMTDTIRGMTGSTHRESGLARPIEEATANLPSDTFLWLGWGSIVASLVLKLMGRDKDANFVGMWAPVFLIHGVYNKIVKVAGHDRYSRD
jgi:hypothetical protein